MIILKLFIVILLPEKLSCLRLVCGPVHTTGSKQVVQTQEGAKHLHLQRRHHHRGGLSRDQNLDTYHSIIDVNKHE